MVEHYVSDDEQAERIKKWLKENGSSLVAGIVLGVAVIFGWQWWVGHRAATAEQASLNYELLLQAIQNDNAEQARQQGNLLFEDYGGSPYATLGALMLAKHAVERNDPDAAAQYLQWAVDNGDRAETRDVARLRLARLRLAQERTEDALQLLDAVRDPSFTVQVQELRGDIHRTRGETEQARAAYLAARAAAPPGNSAGLLEMKLDNLPPGTE